MRIRVMAWALAPITGFGAAAPTVGKQPVNVRNRIPAMIAGYAYRTISTPIFRAVMQPLIANMAIPVMERAHAWTTVIGLWAPVAAPLRPNVPLRIPAMGSGVVKQTTLFPIRRAMMQTVSL